MDMHQSANDDTSFRSENEISVVAVKTFYQFKERPFDDALNAIVAGCVTECTFDIENNKFDGIVESFDGSESYGVKIFVTDDFAIQFAFCDCLQQSCYHIGAVALHSGFKTPIFSRLPSEEANGLTSTTTDESYNEFEFVDLKAQQNEDCDINESFITSEEQSVPIEQMFADENNKIDRNCANADDVEAHDDPISIPNKLKLNKANRKRKKKELRKPKRRPRLPNGKYCRKTIDRVYLEWKVLPTPLTVTPEQWSIAFNSEKNQFNSLSFIIMEELNAQFENISCSLRSEGQYTTANYHKLRFRCMIDGCSRFYSMSIHRNQIEKGNYAFEVRSLGKLKHADVLGDNDQVKSPPDGRENSN